VGDDEVVMRLIAAVQAKHILGSISSSAGIRLREESLGLPSTREMSMNKQWRSLTRLQRRSTWHTKRG